MSALFLLAIAVMNLFILASVYRAFHRVKNGGTYAEDDLDVLLAGGGLLARIFRPLFGIVRKSWHMYPLGLLFGLGFDTATEIGLLGISAAEAAKGMPIWSIMVFPALFTAGMSLVDTADNVLMVGAYGWAFTKPIRKLYYNLTITFVSVVVALLVGGIEALGLIAKRAGLHGAVLGCDRRAEQQLRQHRLSDRRRVRRLLGGLGAGLSSQALRRPRGRSLVVTGPRESFGDAIASLVLSPVAPFAAAPRVPDHETARSATTTYAGRIRPAIAGATRATSISATRPRPAERGDDGNAPPAARIGVIGQACRSMGELA